MYVEREKPMLSFNLFTQNQKKQKRLEDMKKQTRS